VTNYGTTFVLFNHEIQWDRNADGSYAHVGYNSRGNDIFNLPLSGTSFIGCTLNGDCESLGRKKRARVNGTITREQALTSTCLPTEFENLAAVLNCVGLYRMDVDFSATIFNTAANLSQALEPCPREEYQAYLDTGRFTLSLTDADNNYYCYRAENSLLVTVNGSDSFIATQRCCYNVEG